MCDFIIDVLVMPWARSLGLWLTFGSLAFLSYYLGSTGAYFAMGVLIAFCIWTGILVCGCVGLSDHVSRFGRRAAIYRALLFPIIFAICTSVFMVNHEYYWFFTFFMWMFFTVCTWVFFWSTCSDTLRQIINSPQEPLLDGQSNVGQHPHPNRQHQPLEQDIVDSLSRVKVPHDYIPPHSSSHDTDTATSTPIDVAPTDPNATADTPSNKRNIGGGALSYPVYDIGGEEVCSICLVEYEPSDTLISLPCQHEFHEECILAWFKGHRTCPMCNYNFHRERNESQPSDNSSRGSSSSNNSNRGRGRGSDSRRSPRSRSRSGSGGGGRDGAGFIDAENGEGHHLYQQPPPPYEPPDLESAMGRGRTTAVTATTTTPPASIGVDIEEVPTSPSASAQDIEEGQGDDEQQHSQQQQQQQQHQPEVDGERGEQQQGHGDGPITAAATTTTTYGSKNMGNDSSEAMNSVAVALASALGGGGSGEEDYDGGNKSGNESGSDSGGVYGGASGGGLFVGGASEADVQMHFEEQQQPSAQQPQEEEVERQQQELEDEEEEQEQEQEEH